MGFFKSILSFLYTTWVIMVFTVFMIILLPGIILPILLGQKFGRVTFFFIKIWSWIFSMLTFIRYDIEGREHIQKGKSYIYTSNHTSFLDAPGLSLGIPTQFRPLAKKELKKIPIFGLIVRVVTVVVDRSSGESRRKSIDNLKSILRSGISILIFPEGTQNRSSMPLQPFFDGAFRIALQTETPILPIVIINAGKLMPPSRLRVRPGRIRVVFGAPVYITGPEMDLQTLKETTKTSMLEIIEKYSPRYSSSSTTRSS